MFQRFTNRLALHSAKVRQTMTERAEAGMATAEYAIVTIAAVGFAGVLVLILRSDAVRGMLMNIVRSALSI